MLFLCPYLFFEYKAASITKDVSLKLDISQKAEPIGVCFSWNVATGSVVVVSYEEGGKSNPS